MFLSFLPLSVKYYDSISQYFVPESDVLYRLPKNVVYITINTCVNFMARTLKALPLIKGFESSKR